MNRTQYNDIRADSRVYIREMQRCLQQIERAENGATDVPADGIFGESTAAAVREVQRKAGLPVTGVVDGDTWEAIGEACAQASTPSATAVCLQFWRRDTPPLSPGDKGDGVQLLQCVLRRVCEGYLNLPPVDIPDGVYSENTARAIRSIQRLFGMQETGITDRDTWNRVAALYNGI